MVILWRMSLPRTSRRVRRSVYRCLTTLTLKPLDFWALGNKLYMTTPERFPVPFIPGDVFDPNHIAPREPFYSAPTSPRPTLSTLTSLTPLQGHISAMHVSSFFHLFTEDEQLAAARALATLLSPEPGSMIFGMHGSQPTKGDRPQPNVRGKVIFCHTAESWTELWDGVVFKKGTVDVSAKLLEGERRVPAQRPDGKWYRMVWCVKRK